MVRFGNTGRARAVARWARRTGPQFLAPCAGLLRGLPLLACLALAAGAAAANDEVRRQPTPEERRMMTLQLETAGFAPCTTVSLVDSRWACAARDAAGKGWQLQLSNLDFSVLARRAAE